MSVLTRKKGRSPSPDLFFYGVESLASHKLILNTCLYTYVSCTTTMYYYQFRCCQSCIGNRALEGGYNISEQLYLVRQFLCSSWDFFCIIFRHHYLWIPGRIFSGHFNRARQYSCPAIFLTGKNPGRQESYPAVFLPGKNPTESITPRQYSAGILPPGKNPPGNLPKAT